MAGFCSSWTGADGTERSVCVIILFMLRFKRNVATDDDAGIDAGTDNDAVDDAVDEHFSSNTVSTTTFTAFQMLSIFSLLAFIILGISEFRHNTTAS